MRGGSRTAVLGLLAGLTALCGCGMREDPLAFSRLTEAPERLSAWGVFDGEAREQQPTERVVPYDIRTPLFSDYATKLRFVKLPPGEAARYSARYAFDFPVGTVIAKTFAYPADLRHPGEDLDLVETRILVHQEEGWMGLPYIWNEEETEATLALAGGRIATRWTDLDGHSVEHEYLVPNANQCKGCHRASGRVMTPLGAKARYMNRSYPYRHGSENQLAYWSRRGYLEGAPPAHAAPRVPVWDDPATGTLDERARAYLEINCAHCHNPAGPARTTGLDFSWGPKLPVQLGVYKYPVAAGRGSGDRLHGISPGRPDESILLYRVESLDPGVMMPELGRRLVHREGVALLREWIAAMPEPTDPPHPAG